MKKSTLSRIIKCTALLLSVVFLLLFLQTFLFTHWDSNTCRLRDFYREEKNSLDVVFLGASEVYTGFSPGYAYDQFGFTSYMYSIADNEGTLYKAQMKEILAYQDPQLIFVEVYGFLHATDERLYEEARLRIFTESIPMSANKLETIMQHPYEDKVSCLFPFIKYHGNLWLAKTRLGRIIKPLFADDIPMSLKGMCTRTVVYKGSGDKRNNDDPSYHHISPTCEELLIEFLDFCKQEGLDNIVFVNFPRYLADEDNSSLLSRVRIVEQIIESYDYPFLNLQDHMTGMGIDKKQDFYNPHHLNAYGQKKLTAYLGNLITNTYGLVPMEQTAENTLGWEEAAACSYEYFALAEQAMQEGEDLRLYEQADVWIFRRDQ